MIKNKDRSGWFGASDVKFIMGNWNTATFMEWWQIKLGIKQNQFKNTYTVAGTNKEHQLANHFASTHNIKIKLDRQIKIRRHRLRVNLDCETKQQIIEIKTHKHSENWKLPKEYIWQVQVQMFATKKHNAIIYAYGLLDEDYNNFFLPIDDSRIQITNIEYDHQWVTCEFLPRLFYLAKCLNLKQTPKNYKNID